ncbi:MAG: type II secretion system F family protein [Hyphomicrobiales bacterium]
MLRIKGASNILSRDISLGTNKFSDKKKNAFFQELSLLTVSKINMLESLVMISTQTKCKITRSIVQKLKDSLIKGSSLSESLESTGFFSLYDISSIRIGEETGLLEKVLQELASYYNDIIEQRKRIINSLTYPVVVLLIAILVVAFMLGFLVPMFSGIFKQFGKDLPGLTVIVINIAEWFSEHFLLISIILFIVFLLYKIFRDKELFRDYSSRIVLRIPFIGNLILKIYLARLCVFLELMTSAKIPLNKGFDLGKQMINFYPLEKILLNASEMIFTGNDLKTCFSESNILVKEQRFISLLAVGESTNRLNESFKRLKEIYQKEVKEISSVIGNLVEPFVIIFIGIFVGIILISMYLPMFQLGTSIST